MTHRLLIALPTIAALWPASSSLFLRQDPPGGNIVRGDQAAAPLSEGSWTSYGRRNILGAGTDTTITLKQFPEEPVYWTITYTIVRHPPVNKPRAPEMSMRGPFRVTVDADRHIMTIFAENGRQMRYTFILTEESLLMPALVEIEAGHSLYVNEQEQYEVRCEHDPKEVPVGRASIWDVDGLAGFYSYEEAPRSRDTSPDKAARYLRLLERVEDGGYLIERGRLIWDQWGSPRYERLLSTGEISHDRVGITVYSAAETGT